MTWISLHTHSQYSILTATPSIHDLVQKAKKEGATTLALTDFSNLFGAVDFVKECQKQKIRPILGCQLMLAPTLCTEKKRVAGHAAGYPLILLAKNKEGYKSLCKLSSLAHTEGFYYTPRIDKELLSKYSEGLICLSGNFKGWIGNAILSGDEQAVESEVSFFHELFGEDFYFDLQRHALASGQNPEDLFAESWQVALYKESIEKEERVNNAFCKIGKEKKIACVCTRDVRYLEPGDFYAHEVLMNIGTGEPCKIEQRDHLGNALGKRPNPKREVLFSRQNAFPVQGEMEQIFSDLPEVIAATVECAQKCTVDLDFQNRFYPVFVPPHLEGKHYTPSERKQEAENFLVSLCRDNIAVRYTKAHLDVIASIYKDKDPMQVVEDRLSYELNIILSKGMCDYLLIVYDFIAWAKRSGIAVGPGRGSGAGSIILYLIGITDIEPLRFHLFFERFINPERISYPDIDVDICMERRSEVIDYTVDKYGKDKVAQIITFGTMKAKMAIKDVGRVLDVPLAKVNEMAKLVPDDLSITLAKAVEVDADLALLVQKDKEMAEVFELAKKLEGSVRNTGIHAAGLIICADPLTDHIPVCLAKDSHLVATQYSMKPVESVGMLKIDFLGLKTLTSIQKCVELIQKSQGHFIDWVNLPLDDRLTYELLNQGKTSGIFQLESSGMQELAKQLHIDRFEEIIAVGALYRPGPMDMIPSFIARKHGKEKIEYDHPWMEDILKETYGIMVYQEQVMQIAEKLAGYSLGEGDVLRRAMGKKDRDEMARQRKKFISGAVERKINEEVASAVFDKMEKFASYGFNKSHAAAYGYVSYVTAFFKANYPKEWMSALMSADRDDVDKVAKHIRDAHSMHIPILPPDVNESIGGFFPATQGIRFGLSAIKGVGEGIVEAILLEREKQGPYTCLQNFLERCQARRMGKKSVELLIDAGAFDFCHLNRPTLKAQLELLFASVLQKQKEEEKGFLDLFAHINFVAEVELPTVLEEDRFFRLKREKELLGFYITGHPLDDWKEKMQELEVQPIGKLAALPGGQLALIAVTIEAFQVKIASKSQRKFASLFISDGEEMLEMPLWPDLYESLSRQLAANDLLLIQVYVDQSQASVRINAKNVMHLSDFDPSKAMLWQKECKAPPKIYKPKAGAAVEKKESFLLGLDLATARLSDIMRIKKLIDSHPGAHPYELIFWREQKKSGQIKIEGHSGIDGSQELILGLKSISSVKEIQTQGG